MALLYTSPTTINTLELKTYLYILLLLLSLLAIQIKQLDHLLIYMAIG